jgi:hypothetical protein
MLFNECNRIDLADTALHIDIASTVSNIGYKEISGAGEQDFERPFSLWSLL